MLLGQQYLAGQGAKGTSMLRSSRSYWKSNAFATRQHASVNLYSKRGCCLMEVSIPNRNMDLRAFIQEVRFHGVTDAGTSCRCPGGQHPIPAFVQEGTERDFERLRSVVRVQPLLCRLHPEDLRPKTGAHDRRQAHDLYPGPRATSRCQAQPPSGPYRSKAFLDALRQFWALSDGLCGKRLVAFIREIVPLLERQGRLRIPQQSIREQLVSASAATVDRILAKTKRES